MSEDAIISDAQRAGKLSAPFCERSSPKVASEALPEIGLVNIKGKSSFGTPILSKKGETSWLSSSPAPEAVSMLTPTINAHRVGSRFTADTAPFFAPLKKLSK